MAEITDLVHAAGQSATLMIAAAFGCQFEGQVPFGRVMALVQNSMDARPDEIALADTIGITVPTAVADLFGRLRPLGISLRAHFHNTRNAGYANVVAALETEVQLLDASAGSIGGRPFAPRATGNIGTEDLAYLLEGMRVRHGIDGQAVAALDPWPTMVLGHVVPATLGKTDPFPPEPQ